MIFSLKIVAISYSLPQCDLMNNGHDIKTTVLTRMIWRPGIVYMKTYMLNGELITCLKVREKKLNYNGSLSCVDLTCDGRGSQGENSVDG